MYRLSCWSVLLCLLVAIPRQHLLAEQATGKRGMVASVQPLATKAGVDIFNEGGNAIDAAIATALTLGVVDNHNSGIGGGCFILIRTADGKLTAIDGREIAPAAATADMYMRDGKAVTQLSQLGSLASGVPGALAAYDKALKKYGSKKLAEVLAPGAKLAKDGFRIDRIYASKLRSKAADLAKFAGTRAVLLDTNGHPRAEGSLLIQKDLANTYNQVASQGIDWFYQGEFAEKTAAWMSKNGGIMTAEDFASYRALEWNPVQSNYREFSVVGFPPPSSGGVHVAQVLNILEGFDLKKLYREDRAKFVHVIAEAMKLAFADRAHWLGDPNYAKVPRGLVSAEYAAKLRSQIDPDQVSVVTSHGTPPNAEADFFGKHTTHVAAADADGNWVAITATVNTTFGSKVIVPGLGVVMNNEMDDFSIAPGVPNAFGLIGAKANEVEPGKRPLSSMSPTIVLKNGRPVMTVGAAGGPKIITQVILSIINHLDLGMSIEDSIGAPRFHHQWAPDSLLIESSTSASLIKEVKAYGHQVNVSGTAGITQGIVQPKKDGLLIGAHDPRVPGKAAGF